MAHLLGEAVGEGIGYQVRFERRIGVDTRIQVLTEGILTRRLQGDPALDGVGLLIFDEFHERSLQADLGLALALDCVSALRPDLRLLVMSATLDTQAVSDLLGGAPIIRGEGRAHPVEVIYAERSPGNDPVAALVAGVRRAFAERTGDLLAFLPGSREIRHARERLQAALGGGVVVLPLHGSLSVEEQDLALRPNPGPTRRVVLATDIAETSVTIEGVTTVVDTGLTRKPRFDPGTGLTRLVTEPVSRAAAHQRAGRAGRLGPGTCYRLWTQGQEVGRPDHRPAEILQADLAPLALELALWGVRQPAELAWLDPPPPGAWAHAVKLLQRLDALDESGAITALGRRMAELPIHPRLARLLAGAPVGESRRLAADLAALLADRDPWISSPGMPRPADLGLRLQALQAFRETGQGASGERSGFAAADRLSRQLRRQAGDAGQGASSEPGALLALAYPDRVAKRRPGVDGRYLLAAGTGAVLPVDDPLAVQELLVVADLDAGGREGRIRLALPLSEAALRRVLADHIEIKDAVYWDAGREAVAVRREERLGVLVISSHPQPLAHPEQAVPLLTEQIERRFAHALSWSPDARQLQARVALLRRVEPGGGWPDLADEWLAGHLADWLGPWLPGKQSLAEVHSLDLTAVLLSRLDWKHRRRLDEEAPTALATPAGTRRRLDYTAGEDPVLAVPLQEMFGAATTPSVCSGRVALTLHLLSPARRPLQVTRDLAGFWAGSYTAVRKEMRGRYPKHQWPEDPAHAKPMSGGIRRQQ
jgi:ATP-dependent helicase HrpB